MAERFKLITSPLLFLSLLVFVVCESTLEYTVEHKFSSASDYTVRGSLNCDLAGSQSKCAINNNDDLKETFDNLLSGEGFYYLRICDKEKRCLQTFTKQCLLIESKLREELELRLSARNEVTSISLLTPASFCTGASPLAGSSVVKTKVEIQEFSQAPEPETAFFIKQVEAEKLKKQKGETEDNRSFLAKYWMYIVPVLVIVMFMDKAGGEQQ